MNKHIASVFLSNEEFDRIRDEFYKEKNYTYEITQRAIVLCAGCGKEIKGISPQTQEVYCVECLRDKNR